MLNLDPAERLTMDGILTHPWFKMTLYDNVQEAVSTDNPRVLSSAPHSPLPGGESQASKLFLPRSASATSFPFSPRSSRLAVALETIAAHDPESEPSETSFEFTDPLQKSTSGDTSPTTAETEDEMEEKRKHSGEFSHTELALELAHLNTSESTIRNMGSESANFRAKLAKRSSLDGKFDEADSEGASTSRTDKRLSSSSLTVIDEHSIPLPVADHSRTPVRTKRRSLTSQLPLERRLSHQSTSSQWQAFVPEDYLALLNAERPPLFSTPSEKVLLNRLSDLGFDTGQLIHSVMHDACDTSAAMWWILRLKQVERGETDDVVQARQASAVRKREREKKRTRERRSERNHSPSPNVTVSKADATLGATDSRPMTPDGENRGGLHVPGSRLAGQSISPPLSPHGTRSPSHEASPSRDKEKGLKTRSPSMNMLQRATSVLVLGVKKTTKDNEDKEGRITPEPQEVQKRGDSPTKHHHKLAIPKLSKNEGDGNGGIALSSRALSRETTPSNEIEATPTPPNGETPPPGDNKATKKDSFWTTFRHLFNEDRRRSRKRELPPAATPVKPPTVVPTRAPPVRGTGMSRTSQPSSSRRASFDGRAMYSHRSSSVNSRRSSIASNHMGSDYAINLHDVGLHSSLNRRLSGRSQRSQRSGGSRTPTSDREPLSRPGSSHSRSRNRSRPSSLRSPTINSDLANRFRGGVPPSPIHDYHRRSASGSASTRVRHIKVIHEAKALRPSSVASSTRSNPSSRASSFDLNREDLDMGRDDYDHSRRGSNTSLHSLALHSHSRMRSPLVRGLKPPLRDVFQNKVDDEWEDEDDDGTFAGGLGQAMGGYSSSDSNSRAANHPGSSMGSRFNSSVTRHPRNDDKTSGSSRKTETNTSSSTSSSSGGSSRARRGGLPATRNQAPVIEEEEEEEE